MPSIRLGNNQVYRDGNIHQLSGPGDSASSGNIIRAASADQIAQYGSAGRGAGGGTSFIDAADFTQDLGLVDMPQVVGGDPNAAFSKTTAPASSSIQQPIDARYQNLLNQAGQQAINPTLPTGADVKGIQIESIQPGELQTAPLIICSTASYATNY